MTSQAAISCTATPTAADTRRFRELPRRQPAVLLCTKIRACECTALSRTIPSSKRAQLNPAQLKPAIPDPNRLPPLHSFATLSCRWHPQGAHRQDFYPAVGDHCIMQLGDGLTACPDEQEREDGVDKTSTRPQQHLAAEPRGLQQMPPVGLPDRGRMFVEETLNIHAHRLDPSARYRVANIGPCTAPRATKLRGKRISGDTIAWISSTRRFWNSSRRMGL